MAQRSADGTAVDRVVLRATRAFLRVTSRAEAVEVMHRAIGDLGGEVVPRPFDGVIDPDLASVDVSLGVGGRSTVRTPATAAADVHRHLPGLLADAVLAADRADEVARSRVQAALDPLTQVVNQGQIARRLETTQPGAVVCVLDLDGFKEINDSRGHLAGDATLRRFGRHLRTRTRRGDFVARAGGDEFLVILEGDIGTSAAHRRMTDLARTWARSEQTSTVSIGIAAVADAGPIAAAAAADRAMYRAKRGEAPVEIAGETDDDPRPKALASDTYDAYLAGLTAADTSMAVAALVRGADNGMSEHDLVSDVIARAQCEVGALWAVGDWGIAEEHAATVVAEQALTLISPTLPLSSVATRVLMVCPEGESHTMPARLAAQLARSPELEIIVLGGSTPAASLVASLQVLGPSVLALSVTVATNLIGAFRCIEAARTHGVPVIVGGAAWGATQRRAERLGADRMLIEAGDLADLVHDGALSAGTVAPAALHDEAILLERPAPALMKSALARWVARQESHPTSVQLNEALNALDWVTRHAAAAVACDDPTVVGDLIQSQIQAARSGGVEMLAIVDVYLALAEALDFEAPRAAALLRGQTRRLTPQS